MSSPAHTGFPPMSRLSRFLFCLAFGAILLFAPACSNEKKGGPAQPPVPVLLGQTVIKDMPFEIAAIGHVEAFATAVVKPEVNGQIKSVHFKEGSFVPKGALLFTIDKAPYLAAMNQARANLARDAATLAQNKRDLDRYAELVKDGLISHNEFELMQTKVESSQAAVTYDRAALERVELDLAHCEIRSAFPGRTGAKLLDLGNIVKANETALVEVSQIEPVSVSFSVPEGHLASIQQFSSKKKIEVMAEVESDGLPPSQGFLNFIDNKVTRETGTIGLKAEFPNKDRVLWPGQYVTVSMRLDVEKARVVVPTRAVQAGPEGPFVFVVGQDKIAQIRPVVVSRKVGEETVLSKGLEGKETVVVDGHLRLYPGATIFERPLSGPPPQQKPVENPGAKS